jgi:cell division protein ZapA
MPDLEINIGDRKFFVSCRPGEEHFLNAAAKMLDSEATPLQAQMGRLPEARMLLMAGLMLADRTASLEDELRQARAKLAGLENRVEPDPGAQAAAVVAQPPSTETLAQLAAEAESLAAAIEERLA